jgi:hypothetical protein
MVVVSVNDKNLNILPNIMTSQTDTHITKHRLFPSFQQSSCLVFGYIR